MNDSKIPPRILFKYRYFDDNGYHLKSLDEIYFAPPGEFNDPFDTGIPILYHSSGTSSEKILEHMIRNNPEYNQPLLQEKEIRKPHAEFIQKIVNPESARNLDTEAIRHHANQTGVFSLTEEFSNILMWSHYSLNHTGFCIGYRSFILYEYLRTQTQVIFVPMIYVPESPLINPYDPNQTLDEYFSSFTHKYGDWSYEREWRLILLNGAKSTIQIPENVIEAVYLGLRISKINADKIIEKLKARSYKPPLFRAREKFNSFELDFEQINY